MIPVLSAAEKAALLEYARLALAWRLEGGGPPPQPRGEAMEQSCGAFVSLHKGGELRGCIGRIVGGKPLVETIFTMAQAAAFEDPRFEALEKEELGQIDIEITLLSPMRRIDDVAEIQVGRHGLYIVKGWHSGLLLPQVPVEQGWDRASFLQQICHKAGLQADAWRAPDAELFVFEGLVFGEAAKRGA